MNYRGKIVITLIVLAILGIAGWRFWDKIAPSKQVKTVDIEAVKQAAAQAATVAAQQTAKSEVAKSDAQKEADMKAKLLAGTKQASLVDSSTIPPVAGRSDYKTETKNGKMVVSFPINIWPGWAPIIVANNGMAANDDSIFYKKYGFYVDLKIIDDPVKQRDLFAAGHLQVMWGTLDMFALFGPELAKDSRTTPVIVQQIDWSNGGDGVVARHEIKTINDFRPKNGIKKKVVLAQNSPSHYFIMSLLTEANINPSEIDFKWAADAPSAAKIYVEDKNIDAFVGWSPDIYTVAEGDTSSRLVVTTHSANNLIADVYAFRNDFSRDHPDIVANMVRGIFEGMDLVRQNPDKAAAVVAAAFNLPVDDVKGMIGKDGGITTGDAHLTNYRENTKFFLDEYNPANFKVVWARATSIYQQLGAIDQPLSVGKVMAASVLAGMSQEYKDVRDLGQPVFRPGLASKSLEATDKDIITKSISIKFEPNQFVINTNYDKTIPDKLMEIGKLVGAFGYAVISIEGNTDASKRGVVSADDVRRLSYDRASAVKEALLSKYQSIDPNRIVVKGNGWDVPLPGMTDNSNTENNKANRRVDVRVVAVEEDETK